MWLHDLGAGNGAVLIHVPHQEHGISCFLATASRRAGLSFTWLTVPEEEEMSAQRMVWIESMTTRSGFSFSIRPQISSTSFSAAR